MEQLRRFYHWPVRHECRQRKKASSSVPLNCGDLESIDLQNSKNMIDFVFRKAIGKSTRITQIPNDIMLHFFPMVLGLSQWRHFKGFWAFLCLIEFENSSYKNPKKKWNLKKFKSVNIISILYQDGGFPIEIEIWIS